MKEIVTIIRATNGEKTFTAVKVRNITSIRRKNRLMKKSACAPIEIQLYRSSEGGGARAGFCFFVGGTDRRLHYLPL